MLKFQAMASSSSGGAAALANSLDSIGQGDKKTKSRQCDVSDLHQGDTSTGAEGNGLQDEVADEQEECFGCSRLLSVVERSSRLFIFCCRCYNLWAWLYGYLGEDEDTIYKYFESQCNQEEFKSLSDSSAMLLDKIEPPKKKKKIIEIETAEFHYKQTPIRFTEVNSDVDNADTSAAIALKIRGRTFYGVPGPNVNLHDFPKTLDTTLGQCVRYEKKTTLNDGSAVLAPDQQERWWMHVTASVHSRTLPKMPSVVLDVPRNVNRRA